jgi:hypothetical protein
MKVEERDCNKILIWSNIFSGCENKETAPVAKIHYT